MDVSLLIAGCKQGDLASVKYLVEQREVNLNIRDKWDSTPLYYACLCGHEEIVRYLLENGARCEVNTFDGERCMYGALNMEIRSLLRNYKVISSCHKSSNFYIGALKRVLENGDYADVSFVVGRSEFCVHRCILSARSTYFNDMFHNKWLNRSTINIKNFRVNPRAFKAILNYIYTDEMEILIEDVDDYVLLAKQCQLSELLEKIDKAVKKIYTFACTKPGTKVTTINLESDYESLNYDFAVLAAQALPPKFHQWVGGSELPFLPNPDHVGFEDVCILVENQQFFCHKVFVCGRSDYFKALFRDHFMETILELEGEMISIHLNDISADIFINILNFMYQDAAELSEDTVYETLCAADLYLLPGLKRLCATFIANSLTVDNCIGILRIAKLYQLPRLENQAVEFMSHHVFKLVEKTEFEELIKEEAETVKNREEVDSVPLIDDIRFHITNNVQTVSDMDEANDKLFVIDDFLERLGLDG